MFLARNKESAQAIPKTAQCMQKGDTPRGGKDASNPFGKRSSQARSAQTLLQYGTIVATAAE